MTKTNWLQVSVLSDDLLIDAAKGARLMQHGEVPLPGYMTQADAAERAVTYELEIDRRKTQGIKVSDHMLESCTRLGNTPNGNPRWVLHTDHGSFKMKDDAQDSHVVGAFQNAGFRSHYANGVPVALTFHGALVIGINMRDGRQNP